MTAKTFAVHTLGCKVNSYESNAISAILEKKGLKLVDFELPTRVTKNPVR